MKANASSKLKEIRLRRRMSLSETAKLIGVAPSTYRRWENGKKIPAEALAKLASLHRTSLSEFLDSGGDETESLRKGIYYLEEGLELIKRSLNHGGVKSE